MLDRGFAEMQGGLPVVVDGEVIGAIGESFATPAEDEEVAKEVLASGNFCRRLDIIGKYGHHTLLTMLTA
jgi:uncharacterized protein GlcG (DUF336 family)